MSTEPKPEFVGDDSRPASVPPLPPPPTKDQTSPARDLLSLLLIACLAIYLADGFISVADDSLKLGLGLHLLTGFRVIMGLLALLLCIVVYCLMGVTPWIPKRMFLPLTLLNLLGSLLVFPVAIYAYGRLPQAGWMLSVCQVILGLVVLCLCQGGLKFRWPLVPISHLAGRGFSWLNLLIFLAGNVFVLLPAVLVYLLVCTSVAVDHFTDGFLALRPGGLTVKVRKYVRDDGKTVQLFPMSHVGDSSFYRDIAQTFPTNSIILMEGVSDDHNLLTNKISYRRMAASIGVSEQAREFKPTQGEMVRADVDVAQFATNTISFLNMVMIFHARGVQPDNVQQLLQYAPPPHFEEQLFNDLLTKRNQHVLREMTNRLAETDHIIVPWGAAHMPGIAGEVLKSGFHLAETQEYVVISFGSKKHKSQPAEKGDKE